MKNQNGQGLIEYLVIVALVAVGSLLVMRTLGSTVQARFGNINNALQGDTTEIQAEKIHTNDVRKKTLNDFFQGAR